tara:strand:+ start:261 stop:551 length:291 start_codon:yes stop_codon:yes gene_type:complete
VTVIGINVFEQIDTLDGRTSKAQEFRDHHNISYPILVDPDDTFAMNYGVKSLPTNLIIDREGKIQYQKSGFNQKEIVETISKLVNRKVKLTLRTGG